MDTPENAPQGPVAFDASWDVNPYQTPTIVNQMVVSEGPGTQFGSDGLVYLTLGHVAPPLAPLGNGPVSLTVATVGNFVMTVERAQELVEVLKMVISNNSAISHRGEGYADRANA